MNFTLNKTYTWREVVNHWRHMADGGMDDWTPPKEGEEEPPGRLPEITTWKLVELPINEIKGHHPCDDYNQDVIADYIAYRKRTGSEFPPIIVEEKNDTYQTLDGCHRLAAAKKDGDKTIRAFVPWTNFKEKVASKYKR